MVLLFFCIIPLAFLQAGMRASPHGSKAMVFTRHAELNVETCWHLITYWFGKRGPAAAALISQLGCIFSLLTLRLALTRPPLCDLINSAQKISQHKNQQLSAGSAYRDDTEFQNQHRARVAPWGWRPEMDGHKISPFGLWETSNLAQLFRKPQLQHVCDRCSS